IVDDRHRKTWRNESEYRLLQRKTLEKAGIKRGDCILVTSPDERWENNAQRVIRDVIDNTSKPTIYKFHLREMFNPTDYRTDGIWGMKTRPSLYPYLPNQKFSKKRIQQLPTHVNGVYKIQLLNINIYHLKNIEPESRAERVAAYKLTD